MRPKSAPPERAAASRAASKQRHPVGSPAIPKRLQASLDKVLEEAEHRHGEIVLYVPTAIEAASRHFAERFGSNIKQHGARRALYEAYVWTFWKVIGIPQMEAIANGADGWVGVHSKLRLEVFGTKYKERLDSLTTEKYGGKPFLEKTDGYKVDDHPQAYRLRAKILPRGKDDGPRIRVNIRELIANEKITESLARKVRDVRARVREEGPGRATTILSAHKVMRTRACSGGVPQEFRSRPSVEPIVSGIGDFFVSTDEHTGRVYTPVTAMQSRARDALTAPDGAPLIAWDWPSHQWWVALMLVKEHVPDAEDLDVLTESLAVDSLYDQCVMDRCPGRDYGKGLGKRYVEWLEKQKKESSPETARAFVKILASVLLHKPPEKGRARNIFVNWLGRSWPGFAYGLGVLRDRFPGKHFSRELFRGEARIRTWVLNELYARKVTFLLCEHDGGRVPLLQAPELFEVMEAASLRFFGSHCRPKYSVGGVVIEEEEARKRLKTLKIEVRGQNEAASDMLISRDAQQQQQRQQQRRGRRSRG